MKISNLLSIPNEPKVNLEYDLNKFKKFRSYSKELDFPKVINPKLAYFIGYLQGDGCLEINNKKISFCDEYLDHLLELKNLSENLFGFGGTIRSRISSKAKKECYLLIIHSVQLNEFIHQVFNVNLGIKNNLRIPPVILSNKDILRWYISGLFDADGTLPKNPSRVKQKFVDVTFKDKEFILEIKQALEMFQIKTLKPYCRVAKSPHSDYISRTWELRIRRKEYMVRFLKEIGFAHNNKRHRATELLNLLDPWPSMDGATE